MGKLDVVSEEDRGRSSGPKEPSGGPGLTFEDPFFDATGSDPDGFEHGDERRGTITGETRNTSDGHTRWHIRMESADGVSRIAAEGRLANHPDGRPGSGTLTVSDATGDWADVQRLNVAAKNPRRWKSV